MLLPALFLCFILLLLVVVYYRPPKSWDEIEVEDRKRAAEKGMEQTLLVEARAKKKARSIPKATRREVFARDNYRCVQCGRNRGTHHRPYLPLRTRGQQCTRKFAGFV